MNLNKPYLEEIFNKQIRFEIPVFQRHYVWNEENQWKPLWDDFINKLDERNNKLDERNNKRNKNCPHYTGSIVLFQKTTTTRAVATYIVIDGQQRLTTFQLFITAFREICFKYVPDENLINDLNSLLFNNKLFGQTDYDNQKHKLEPTKFNNTEFKLILDNSYDEVEKHLIKPILNEHGKGQKTYKNELKKRYPMLAAYLFFYEKLEELFEKDLIGKTTDQKETIISNLLLTIKRDFQFVEINLDKDDDPQMIFETMNGRGASLTETDLIRNYIFMRADREQINLNSVYDKYWDEFDNASAKFKWHAQISRGRFSKTHLQFFVIYYLTLKMQNEIRYDQVFYHYKFFIEKNPPFTTVEEELEELNRFSQIYKLIMQPNSESEFGIFCSRLIDMDISTFYPLVLAIKGHKEIPELEKDGMFKALDSYIIRRFLCGYTNKNYNNISLNLIKKLDTCKTAEDFIEYLKSNKTKSNLWPTDAEVKRDLREKPLYEEKKQKSISSILLEIEKFQRDKKKEKIEVINKNLTIEHILPQNWYEHWPLEGNLIPKEEFDNAKDAVMTEEDPNGYYHKIVNRNKKLHTLGNLTLLTKSLNPAVSNKSFSAKKKELAEHSTLLLNKYFSDLKNWDESTIAERTELLIEYIIKIWKY